MELNNRRARMSPPTTTTSAATSTMAPMQRPSFGGAPPPPPSAFAPPMPPPSMPRYPMPTPPPAPPSQAPASTTFSTTSGTPKSGATTSPFMRGLTDPYPAPAPPPTSSFASSSSSSSSFPATPQPPPQPPQPPLQPPLSFSSASPMQRYPPAHQPPQPPLTPQHDQHPQTFRAPPPPMSYNFASQPPSSSSSSSSSSSLPSSSTYGTSHAHYAHDHDAHDHHDHHDHHDAHDHDHDAHGRPFDRNGGGSGGATHRFSTSSLSPAAASSSSSSQHLQRRSTSYSGNYPSASASSSSSSSSPSDSLASYRLFMSTLIAIALATLVLAFFVMGTSRFVYIAWVLTIVILSFVFVMSLVSDLFRHSDAHVEMRKVSDAVREGSEGFLSVQYTSIAVIAVVVAFGLFGIYLFRVPPVDTVSSSAIATVTAVTYLVGAFCSALAGYIGVWVSVRVSVRVSIAAGRHQYADALLLAFRGGAVSACLSASLCILGLTVLYVLCFLLFHVWGGMPAVHVPVLLAGYSFGGALVALFMQLGGGIYTKAADVGADMCGKIEAGIPEDDCRNPAVVADLVGDNVGDNAGSMADVFESIAAEIIGTMILGATLAHEARIELAEPFIFFPLVVHSLDLIVSGIGILLVRPQSERDDPLDCMKRSYAICMSLATVAFVATCRLMLYTDVAPLAWWHFSLCGVIGVFMSFLLIRVTQHYTDYSYGPVKSIAAASQTGHGTNVIAGIAVGLESTGIPIVCICVCLLSAYALGQTSGLPAHSAGIFGTAVATMGMLCTAVFVLSMNNFGPIADNAGGICEMSGQPESVRRITDRLDAVGNVTKAASKGYAVGGSALSCFVLFQAFLNEASEYAHTPFTVVNVARVEVVIGALLGVAMIFVFAGWAMMAVGSTAQKVVWEVRRQLKEYPGIMEGTQRPDYNACVAIVTRAALQQMIKPAALALLLPIGVGFTFRFIGEATNRPLLGLEVVAAFMLFGTLTGLCMAIFMDNAGGAWDNAKKLIESQGNKGTEAHKAAVTGDTVGDPFKDTAGPAIHVIITTMSATILVMGPLFVGSVAS